MLETYNLPTVPESYPISISGFDDEERARQFGYTISKYIESLSKYLDLSHLDSVIISNNLDDALLNIDRGVDGLPPLSRTNNENAVGVAQVVDVVRNNIKKHCLILHTNVFAPLENYEEFSSENEHFHSAFHLLVHECAHIHLHTHFDKLFSNVILCKSNSFEDSVLLAPMLIVWDEYAANRIASSIHRAHSMYQHTAKALTKCLDNVHIDCKNGIERFYIHRNIKMLYEDAAHRVFEPIRFFAYHLGNMDGAELDWKHFTVLERAINADIIFSELERIS